MPKPKLPKIGVSSLFARIDSGFPPLIGSEASYIEAIVKAGGVPLILPATDDKLVIQEYCKQVNGVVLIGGEDIEPKYYGEKIHENLGPVSSLRDEFEFALYDCARKQSIPILGICRGLQLINVAQGGTLYQDIPSQLANSNEHRQDETYLEYSGRVHSIQIVDGSSLNKILGTTEIHVNSAHHQAIKKLGKDLKVSASSADGVIEAVELPNKDRVLAVQCHPEVLWQKTEPKWIKLFEWLIKEAS